MIRVWALESITSAENLFFHCLDSLWIALVLNLMDCLGRWFSNISWQRSLSKRHSITGSKWNLIRPESFSKLLFKDFFSLCINHKPDVLHLIATSFSTIFFFFWGYGLMFPDVFSLYVFCLSFLSFKPRNILNSRYWYDVVALEMHWHQIILISKLRINRSEVNIQVQHLSDLLINLIVNCYIHVKMMYFHVSRLLCPGMTSHTTHHTSVMSGGLQHLSLSTLI